MSAEPTPSEPTLQDLERQAGFDPADYFPPPPPPIEEGEEK